jgi:hypothetical protein
MAVITKKTEALVAPFYKNGVTLQFFTITFAGTDLTAKLVADTTNYSGDAARSPVVVALEAIQAKTSVEIIGTPRFSTDTTLVVGIAALGGAYGTDDYNKSGSSVTFAAFLQTLIQNGSTYQGFAMSGATIAAGVRGVTL